MWILEIIILQVNRSMAKSIRFTRLFIRHIALPSDHGSWVFLLSPLLIGLFAGEDFNPASGYLITAALAAFLLRQPLSMVVKIYSGRRNQRELPAAWFWTGIYGLTGLAAFAILISQGYSYLFILVLPAIPVFAWHLYLVSRRAERRQLGVELVGSGMLALAAPAAYWVGVGGVDSVGWLLFALCWLQSAASIVHAYLRLEQRELKDLPTVEKRLRMGTRALLYTTFNLYLVLGLSYFGQVSRWLTLPYLLQWGETLWGSLRPAMGVHPTRIGVRQLIVSSLFTLLFILTWNQ